MVKYAEFACYVWSVESGAQTYYISSQYGKYSLLAVTNVFSCVSMGSTSKSKLLNKENVLEDQMIRMSFWLVKMTVVKTVEKITLKMRCMHTQRMEASRIQVCCLQCNKNCISKPLTRISLKLVKLFQQNFRTCFTCLWPNFYYQFTKFLP